jgi:hypothetical protein
MSITITPEQRDALYGEIVTRLAGIDAVWLAVSREEFKAAERLGREFSDALRFIVEDLSFGEGSGKAIKLKTPPDVLRRVLIQIGAAAKIEKQGQEEKRAESKNSVAEAELTETTCQLLLTALEAE